MGTPPTDCTHAAPYALAILPRLLNRKDREGPMQDCQPWHSIVLQARYQLVSLPHHSDGTCAIDTFLQHVLSGLFSYWYIHSHVALADLSSSLVVGKPCLVIPAPVTEQTAHFCSS